jgi:hypothetical protein
MIQNTIVKKGLIVGIVLLFLTIGFSPIINADGNKIGSIPITIFECKADGTVKRTVFRMSPEQADSFHEEMRNAQDLETKLSIYKKYNLISQDITVDSLREGMEERAQRMGLAQNGLMSLFRIKRSLLPPPPNLYTNINCSVSGDNDCGGFYFVGPLIFWLIFGRCFLILDCSFYSKGDLGEISLPYADLIILLGFEGIVDMGYHETWRWVQYSGFCAYALAWDEIDN